MAEFYGEVQGNRGEAQRTGSKNSGIRATAKSWTTSVEVNYTYNEKEKIVYISIEARNLGTGQRLTLYDGPEDSLLVVNKLQEADEERRK